MAETVPADAQEWPEEQEDKENCASEEEASTSVSWSPLVVVLMLLALVLVNLVLAGLTLPGLARGLGLGKH